MVLANASEKGFFVGKMIHVEFANLGTNRMADFSTKLEGKWILEWNLGGADTSRTFSADEKLGDTGAVVKQVEISPVSFCITLNFPRTGIKLTDGTLLKVLYGGPGTSGYVDDYTVIQTVTSVKTQFLNIFYGRRKFCFSQKFT